jgi:hypothetical protein
MSCASETYPAVGGPHPMFCLLEHSGGLTRPSVTDREIHRASPLAPGGSRIASHVVPDTMRADPEHVWGDEGPVNE